MEICVLVYTYLYMKERSPVLYEVNCWKEQRLQFRVSAKLPPYKVVTYCKYGKNPTFFSDVLRT